MLMRKIQGPVIEGLWQSRVGGWVGLGAGEGPVPLCLGVTGEGSLRGDDAGGGGCE